MDGSHGRDCAQEFKTYLQDSATVQTDKGPCMMGKVKGNELWKSHEI
jgi:hypothetical protein